MPGEENSSSGANSRRPDWTSPGSRRSSSPVVISRSTRDARRRSAASICSWTTSSNVERRKMSMAPINATRSAANQRAIRRRMGSRAKNLMRSRLVTQAVTGAANRVDQTTAPPGFQFVSQAQDMHVNEIRLASDVGTPHAREDEVPGQHAAGVSDEKLQQLELTRRELELHPGS